MRIVLFHDFFFSFVGDTSKYVNLTVDEVDNFALHNLDELMMYFNATLDEAGDSTKALIDNALTAIKFDDIENITNFIYDVSETFTTTNKNDLIDFLTILNVDVEGLSKGLQGVLEGLNNIASDSSCVANPDECGNIINGLTVSITTIKTNLDGFPTINEAIKAIGDINVNLTQIDEMVQLINSAEDSLREFSDKFVNDFTQDISNEIVNITDEIQTQITDLTDELKNIDLSNTPAIKDIEVTIDNFAGYTDIILYATLVPAIILGVALLLSCFGLLFGTN